MESCCKKGVNICSLVHEKNGNISESIRHWKVAASAGDQESINYLMKAYKEKEISKTASAMEIAGEKRSKIEEKAKLDKLIKDRPLFDADYLEAVSRGNNNSGMTINNNIVNSKQEDNSKSENKTIMSKPVGNLSFHEVYVSSY